MRQFFFGVAVLAAMMFCGDVLAFSGDISHPVHHFVLAAAATPAITLDLPILLRFRDLRASGIVDSHTQLARLIRGEDFPSGRLLGRNTRVWTTDEVNGWFAARPTEGRPRHTQQARAALADRRAASKAAAASADPETAA